MNVKNLQDKWWWRLAKVIYVGIYLPIIFFAYLSLSEGVQLFLAVLAICVIPVELVRIAILYIFNIKGSRGFIPSLLHSLMQDLKPEELFNLDHLIQNAKNTSIINKFFMLFATGGLIFLIGYYISEVFL